MYIRKYSLVILIALFALDIQSQSTKRKTILTTETQMSRFIK